MKNNLLKKMFFVAIMLASSFIFAQTVTGTVSDSSGPLPGANVVVKGTTNGTTADFDGNYSISNVPEDGVLLVSFVGYATKEISVAGQAVINVILEADNELDEVVVLGYSSQTRGDVTGAVSSVNMGDAIKAPIVNAAEALDGRVTGVTVVNSGSPGGTPRINIRGFGTSNNTNPLYIIDGVQTDDPNILNNINPSDIDQMNVLKDGAAAIYGARASNGVVIISTKSGGYNMDKAEFSIDMYSGFSEITNVPKMLNAEQHSQMLFQSLVNDGANVADGSLSHGQYDPNGTGTFTVPSSIVGYTRVETYNPSISFYPAGVLSAAVNPGGTNWIDELTRSASTSNVSFSLRNGTESGKYFMSISYLDRQGILLNTGFERLSTRLNSEFKIAEKLKIGEHINLSFSDTKTGNAEAIEGALRMTPLLPVRDNDGQFAGVAGPSLGNTRNPVAQNYRTRNDYNKRFAIFGDVYMSYDILDELTFKTTLAGGMSAFDGRYFTELDPEHGEPISTNTLQEMDQSAYNWSWSNVVNFDKSFGEHDLNVLVGVEALKDGGKGKDVSRTGYLFEDPNYYLLSNGSGAIAIDGDDTYDFYNTLFSIFGTANYSFQDKYFLTATVRRDESSRFLGENKSDIFPSFSAGWDLSNEDFYPEDAFVNRLKIRGSWGELGNQTLPASNPTINISNVSESTGGYSFTGGSSGIATGAILNQVGNPDLKWETSVTTNFGVDLGMLNNRLTVSAEVFSIKTKDLITRDFSLISTTAIDANPPLVNLGDIQNKGFDLAIGYSDQTESGWSYGISANISHYKNEVLKLINGAPVSGRTNDLRGQTPTRTEEGEPISFFYGRNVIGFTDTGRFAYEDVDGDGDTDDDDRTKLGSPHPDFTYGINLNTSYKSFDASLFFTGSQGNDIYNFNKFYTDFPAFVNGNRSVRVLDSWTPTNTDATLPALSGAITNNEGDPNSYYVEDGSFLKLKNVQLGYTLPTAVTDKLSMSSLRFYVQASNLFTITKYEGFDPEIISQDNLSLGIDNRVYPISRIFSLGANIKF
ncbi:SusC/RagA family TonB-linked outer membrane protein [Urechidicola croceus]|uniref:SusC/RagA family TonB-linked outer membrane protein n=1 Tax=Urechidicola croceus TaxID=1850246 RepID=A0A1D8PAB5_9FLAO|nr:TonB-dependent receptor [Urechidicola croceus]AOW21527.1 SusC/RagA family TonB-linked outer membrane protein [Urechidicola croceus]